jgi:hypothetical protein
MVPLGDHKLLAHSPDENSCIAQRLMCGFACKTTFSMMWGLSRSFTLPRTNIVLPGFLFWVALLYAGSGTLITHLIGRPLISLYFQVSIWKPTSDSRWPACANIPSRWRF